MTTRRKPELGEKFVTPWGVGTVTRRSTKSVTLKVETGGIITRPYAEVATYARPDKKPTITVQVNGRPKTYPLIDGPAGVETITTLYGIAEIAKQAHAADPLVTEVEGWVDLMDENEGVVYLIRATPRPFRHRIIGAARLG